MRINGVKEQRASRLAIGAAGLWVMAVLAGCATTQPVKVADKPQVYCPFLGNDVCSKLTPSTTPGRFSTAAVGKATPVLRTVSMVIPQARALATLKYAATGTYAFVGSAQAEGKVVDSVTGQVLAAGVDKRVGGGSITTAAQWQLGDAENAMK